MKCFFILIIILQFVTSNIFLVKVSNQTYEANDILKEEHSSALYEKLRYGSEDYIEDNDDNKGLDEGDQSLNKSRIKDILLKIGLPKRKLFLIGKAIFFCHFWGQFMWSQILQSSITNYGKLIVLFKKGKK